MFISKEKIEEREYQKNIVQSAKDSNTLVVLPAGLGKSMLSSLVMDHRLSKYEGSKALFLAPTRPLVNQHLKTFSGLFSIPCSAVSGNTAKKDRESIYKDYQVIFATPQTIDHDLKSNAINFKDFSLLVVDEAHHAIGNYSYVEIAKNFLVSSMHPLVLALTASPASDREKLRLICSNLGISNLEIRSEDDPDVSPYIKAKLVEERRLEMPEELSQLVDRLERLISAQIDGLQTAGFFKNAPKTRVNRTSILMLQRSLQKQVAMGRRSFYNFRGIVLASKILKLYHALSLLSTQSVQSFLKFSSSLLEGESKADKDISKSAEFIDIIKKAEELQSRGIEHPKLEEIKKILAQESAEGKRAIIFAQYRDTVDAIVSSLKGLPNVSPVRFIGHSKDGLSQKEQIEIIKDFEAGVYNVLVSTSVSEEGISIKGVDIAIFYETVPSAIRSIQRRGRVGRFNVGRIFILITRQTSDESYYWASKRKEKSMKKIVKSAKIEPIIFRQDGTLRPFYS